MIPTIALESTATTIGTIATRGPRDDQCAGVKKDTIIAGLCCRHNFASMLSERLAPAFNTTPFED